MSKEVKNVNEEVRKCRHVVGGTEQVWDGESGESVLVEEVLDGLEERLKLLDTVLEQRCDTMKDKLQELTVFQVCVAYIRFFFFLSHVCLTLCLFLRLS